jgi:nitric oxide reductase NorE protein
VHSPGPMPSPRSESPDAVAAAVRAVPRVPGEPGFWVIIVGDLTAFALLFCVYTFYRGHEVDLYVAAQTRLNRVFGALNMVLLLTSSWFVVAGIDAYREQATQYARRFFSVALLLGAGFVLVKVLEYREKAHEGIVPTTNEFFMFYYVLTGIHLLHLLIGLCVLLWMRSKALSPWRTHHDVALVECGGLYWHMVDLLWVALFALLYLLR